LLLQLRPQGGNATFLQFLVAVAAYSAVCYLFAVLGSLQCCTLHAAFGRHGQMHHWSTAAGGSGRFHFSRPQRLFRRTRATARQSPPPTSTHGRQRQVPTSKSNCPLVCNAPVVERNTNKRKTWAPGSKFASCCLPRDDGMPASRESSLTELSDLNPSSEWSTTRRKPTFLVAEKTVGRLV
jgi:hypothetical protein